MNLVIDIGNTLIKYGLFNHKKLIKSQAFDQGKSAEYFQLLLSKNIKSVLISTVTALPEPLINFTKQSGINPEIFPGSLKLPVTIDYENPQSLGPDRLALACGGRLMFPKDNVLVIGAGTCITYNIVTKNGVFEGGAISPGIHMRFKALNTFTSLLPEVESTFQYAEINGKSTISSILSGVQNGIINEINGMICQFSDKYHGLKIILCGGDTRYLYDKLKNLNFAEPEFLLFSLNKTILFNA